MPLPEPVASALSAYHSRKGPWRKLSWDQPSIIKLAQLSPEQQQNPLQLLLCFNSVPPSAKQAAHLVLTAIQTHIAESNPTLPKSPQFPHLSCIAALYQTDSTLITRELLDAATKKSAPILFEKIIPLIQQHFPNLLTEDTLNQFIRADNPELHSNALKLLSLFRDHSLSLYPPIWQRWLNQQQVKKLSSNDFSAITNDITASLRKQKMLCSTAVIFTLLQAPQHQAPLLSLLKLAQQGNPHQQNYTALLLFEYPHLLTDEFLSTTGQFDDITAHQALEKLLILCFEHNVTIEAHQCNHWLEQLQNPAICATHTNFGKYIITSLAQSQHLNFELILAVLSTQSDCLNTLNIITSAKQIDFFTTPTDTAEFITKISPRSAHVQYINTALMELPKQRCTPATLKKLFSTNQDSAYSWSVIAPLLNDTQQGDQLYQLLMNNEIKPHIHGLLIRLTSGTKTLSEDTAIKVLEQQHDTTVFDFINTHSDYDTRTLSKLVHSDQRDHAIQALSMLYGFLRRQSNRTRLRNTVTIIQHPSLITLNELLLTLTKADLVAQGNVTTLINHPYLDSITAAVRCFIDSNHDRLEISLDDFNFLIHHNFLTNPYLHQQFWSHQFYLPDSDLTGLANIIQINLDKIIAELYQHPENQHLENHALIEKALPKLDLHEISDTLVDEQIIQYRDNAFIP